MQWLKALTHGEPVRGVWHDMTKLGRLKKRWACSAKATHGPEPTKHDVATVYDIEFTPMEMWAHLSEAKRQAKWVETAEVAAKTFPNPHARPPMTEAEVLVQDPHTTRDYMKRSQAPAVHTTPPHPSCAMRGGRPTPASASAGPERRSGWRRASRRPSQARVVTRCGCPRSKRRC